MKPSKREIRQGPGAGALFSSLLAEASGRRAACGETRSERSHWNLGLQSAWMGQPRCPEADGSKARRNRGTLRKATVYDLLVATAASSSSSLPICR